MRLVLISIIIEFSLNLTDIDTFQCNIISAHEISEIYIFLNFVTMTFSKKKIVFLFSFWQLKKLLRKWPPAKKIEQLRIY